MKRVFLLIDSRHGIKSNDDDVMTLLDKAAVSYQIVLTKSDKIKPGALARLVEHTAGQIAKHPAAFPVIVATSSEKKSGIEDLRSAIAAALHP